MLIKNYVALVIDESGSMCRLKSKVKTLVEGVLKSFRETDKKYGQNTFVSIVKFNTKSTIVCVNRPVTDSLHKELDYRPAGGTALWDGFGCAVNLIENYVEKANSAGAIVVITDGEENSSANYSEFQVRNLIKNKQKQGQWTLAFQVPQNGFNLLTGQFGISSDNVQVWDGSEADMESATQSNVQAFSNYAHSRSMGLTSVPTFYKNVDISDLKTKEVKAELHDVSKDFVLLDVMQENNIKDFVEDNYGVYTKGCAAYQLSKKELVQHYKDIFVREKGKKAIFTGNAARQLLGFQIGANVKADPVALGKWEVYVVSTSVNRKLIPGTKLLVRK